MGHEKAHVTERILEGVTALSPAGFVAGLLTGTEKDKLENTGLIILLLLSLTVFGCGIYLGWRLCLVGACPALALVLAACLEEFVWLFMIVVAVGAAAFYFSLRFRSTKKKMPETASRQEGSIS